MKPALVVRPALDADIRFGEPESSGTLMACVRQLRGKWVADYRDRQGKQA